MEIFLRPFERSLVLCLTHNLDRDAKQIECVILSVQSLQVSYFRKCLEAISKMPAGPKSRLMTEFSVHFFRQRHHFVCKKWP